MKTPGALADFTLSSHFNPQTSAFHVSILNRLRLLNTNRLEERHEGPQALPHFLDAEAGLDLALLVEPGPAGGILRDPGVCELAALDFRQHLLHLGLGCVGHDARAASVVAVLSRVADRV